MPSFLRFPEWNGRSAVILSIGSSVPSRITNALRATVSSAAARSGASAARTSTASAMYR